MNLNNSHPDWQEKKYGTCTSCMEYLSFRDQCNIIPMEDDALLCIPCRVEKRLSKVEGNPFYCFELNEHNRVELEELFKAIKHEFTKRIDVDGTITVGYHKWLQVHDILLKYVFANYDSVERRITFDHGETYGAVLNAYLIELYGKLENLETE